MAKRRTMSRTKNVVKKAVKKTTKKVAKKVAGRVARKVTRKATPKRPMSRRPAGAKAARKPAEPKVRSGLITHTELASSEPAATRTWCERVLGWKFGEPMATPTGPYLMWQFENRTGGGIRPNNPPETPGSIPYCEVEEIQVAYSMALEAGAQEMLAPEQLPGGMGWIAIVAAPGGVAIGFWAPK